MAFPDRIERTVELAHPPGKVWAALTTAEGLAAWFGNEAAIDLRPGGAARMKWTEEGFTAEMRVERVEEPNVFGFTWPVYGLPEDDPRRTYVEFTLEPAGAGTRLTVVESGFAQLPEDVYRKAFDGNTEGWAKELGELAIYLDAAYIEVGAHTVAAPDVEAIAEQVFTALADPTRRAILAALASQGPVTATDLAARLPITRQAIAKHLALLPRQAW